MVNTEMEAHLIAGRLKAFDIPAFVLSQVDTTRNFTVGALAVAKVFVPSTLADRAEYILSLPEEPLADDEARMSSDEDTEED